jgi:hypothetical protein
MRVSELLSLAAMWASPGGESRRSAGARRLLVKSAAAVEEANIYVCASLRFREVIEQSVADRKG